MSCHLIPNHKSKELISSAQVSHRENVVLFVPSHNSAGDWLSQGVHEKHISSHHVYDMLSKFHKIGIRKYC